MGASIKRRTPSRATLRVEVGTVRPNGGEYAPPDDGEPGYPSPMPFRGVLPLPLSSLKSAWPVLGNPANRNRAIPLTYEQFRYGFANAVSEDEAKQLYETYSVPGPGKPIFQAATANFNPWTEAKVKTKNPDRGPLLIISTE